ncbi:ModD protein [Sulfurospirillum sp. 1307]|jgi:molybdenum transport protein
MFNLDDIELMNFIKEDVPYIDLTTYLQGAKNKRAKLQIFTREDIVVSCTEEAKRVAELLKCEVVFALNSGDKAKNGEVLLEFVGNYEDIHKAWRSTQLILEYSSAIATYANKMKEQIEAVNPHCELLGTRKNFPFTKRFCIKSIMSGGAMPHRLGLSETVLFFPHHRIVYKNNEEFFEALKDIKKRIPEKKLIVESETYEEAIELIKVGVDVLQMDKVSIETLEKIINYINKNSLHVKVLAAGGINKDNAKEFAKTGISGIVTSAMYFCGMINLGTKMKIVS